LKITKLIFFILGTLCAFNNAIFGQNLKVNKQLLSAPNKHYKYGLIDTETNTVWIKPVYDDLYFIGDSSLVQAKKVDKYGIIDLNGMEIIPFEYEMIISFDGEIFKVQKNGNWGVLNRKNEIEIPINYQYVILENEEYLILPTHMKKWKKYANTDRMNSILSKSNIDLQLWNTYFNPPLFN